jgi:hypothetical protein
VHEIITEASERGKGLRERARAPRSRFGKHCSHVKLIARLFHLLPASLPREGTGDVMIAVRYLTLKIDPGGRLFTCLHLPCPIL